jgi:hypothetical protein
MDDGEYVLREKRDWNMTMFMDLEKNSCVIGDENWEMWRWNGRMGKLEHENWNIEVSREVENIVESRTDRKGLPNFD